MLPEFSRRNVKITLTGEEWFAVLAVLCQRGLSAKGMETYKRAKSKMAAQLTKESDKEIFIVTD